MTPRLPNGYRIAVSKPESDEALTNLVHGQTGFKQPPCCRVSSMKSVILSSVMPLAVAITAVVGVAQAASAAEPDRQFFQSAEGKWVGPGEIATLPHGGEVFRIVIGHGDWIKPFPIRLHF